jgi:hypothetical protein
VGCPLIRDGVFLNILPVDWRAKMDYAETVGEREPGRKPEMPAWARQERQADMGWIGENFHVFWPTAKHAYQEFGRGLLVVDTTQQPIPGGGHPFGYFAQGQIEELDDEDTKRLVREYNPKKEFVVMLLKPEERTSSYRVGRQRRRKRKR